MLFLLIALATIAVVYWFWVRPMLQARPSLAHFWEQERSLFVAIRLKLAGLKERLTAASIVGANVVVLLYDKIAPIVQGVDTSPLTASVPSWVWPLLVISGPLLMLFFRSLADRRAAAGE